MKRSVIAVMAFLAPGAALAETIEVHMMNRGEDGAMVFEPSFVQAQPGDTITFVPTDPGHNAETIEGMLPEGGETFAGDIGKEVSVTLTAEGLYGVECKPHAGMGMVALIQVGAPTNLDAFTEAANGLRGKAKERMLEDLTQVQQDAAAAPAGEEAGAGEGGDAAAGTDSAAPADAAGTEGEAAPATE